jgi:transposase InsO family protein
MISEAVKSKKITKSDIAKKLGISRQSLYYQKKRPIIDEEIRRQIESVLAEHKAYGHKRIAPELKLNKKRILRVMKKFNIKPYRLHGKKPNKKEDEGKATEKDTTNIYKLLCPIAPNVVWVSDFTYIKFEGRFIYLATIMDRYTREIIGIAISRFHNQNLVMEAFMDAERKTGTHPEYLHSDQGSEYTSDAYKIYVAAKLITISFADKASPWQNGFQESFYGKFKVDLGHMEQFESIGELIEAIYQTMYYYNNRRRHTSLNMSPIQFKTIYYIRKEAFDCLSKKMGT